MSNPVNDGVFELWLNQMVARVNTNFNSSGNGTVTNAYNRLGIVDMDEELLDFELMRLHSEARKK